MKKNCKDFFLKKNQINQEERWFWQLCPEHTKIAKKLQQQ